MTLSQFAGYLYHFACHRLESNPDLSLRKQVLHLNLKRQMRSSLSSLGSEDAFTSNIPFSTQSESFHNQPSSPSLPIPSSSPKNFDDDVYSMHIDSDKLEWENSGTNFGGDIEYDNSYMNNGMDYEMPQIDLDKEFDNSFNNDNSLDFNYHHSSRYDINMAVAPIIESSSELFNNLEYTQEPQPTAFQEFIYRYDSTRAQQDWFDSILEDLIEEDDDVDSLDYNNEEIYSDNESESVESDSDGFGYQRHDDTDNLMDRLVPLSGTDKSRHEYSDHEKLNWMSNQNHNYKFHSESFDTANNSLISPSLPNISNTISSSSLQLLSLESLHINNKNNDKSNNRNPPPLDWDHGISKKNFDEVANNPHLTTSSISSCDQRWKPPDRKCFLII